MKTPHNGLPAIHPGEFLRETLDELGLTQAAFAEAIGVGTAPGPCAGAKPAILAEPANHPRPQAGAAGVERQPAAGAGTDGGVTPPVPPMGGSALSAANFFAAPQRATLLDAVFRAQPNLSVFEVDG